jgi:hypothetical protein
MRVAIAKKTSQQTASLETILYSQEKPPLMVEIIRGKGVGAN